MIRGYRRPGGQWGSRNHLLVLPSVVCAGLVARKIAGSDAILINHQHGCDHVGDDSTQTQRTFVGIAANPNVSGVVLVSLGCETIQGRQLAQDIEALGQRLKFVEIQGCGGSANSTEIGQDDLEQLRLARATETRETTEPVALRLGIAVPAAALDTALVDELTRLIIDRNAGAVFATPSEIRPKGEALRRAETIAYGSRPAGQLAIMTNAGTGSEQHAGLAAAGCQVIVSLRGKGSAPIGFPTCPVIAISLDGPTYQALADDFDLDASSVPPPEAAQAVWNLALRTFSGELTASERRGARDFALHRLARST